MTKPNTRTARKNTASHPSEPANAAADIPFPLANPVTTAIAPTQIMSSNIEVPKTYFANGRFRHPISSMTFARSVVAESHIATPRNADCTGPHPTARVPMLYPSQIITTVSTIAAGTATPLVFFISLGENERPMENMRNTTPSCPNALIECGSASRLPPQVYPLSSTPARIYPITLGHPKRENSAAATPATAMMSARSRKNAPSFIWRMEAPGGARCREGREPPTSPRCRSRL